MAPEVLTLRGNSPKRSTNVVWDLLTTCSHASQLHGWRGGGAVNSPLWLSKTSGSLPLVSRSWRFLVRCLPEFSEVAYDVAFIRHAGLWDTFSLRFELKA